MTSTTTDHEQTDLDIALDYRQPIPPQRIEIGDTVLVYDFDALTFLQVMMAEECAMLHMEQQEIKGRDFDEMLRKDHLNFQAKAAACLFVPEGATFSREQYAKTLPLIESLPIKAVKEVEGCLRNFFTLRGKRILASSMLSATGALDRMLSKLIQAQAALGNSQSSNGSQADSSHTENSTDAGESGSVDPS